MGVRTVPYSTPRRRQKHYRVQSRAILRALGAASYLNGSQFAILWVNANGQSEVYSSDLFQRKLDNWFPTPLLNEATSIVVAAQAEREKRLEELSQGPAPKTLPADVFAPNGSVLSLNEDNAPTARDEDDTDEDGEDGSPGNLPSRSDNPSRSQARSRPSTAGSITQGHFASPFYAIRQTPITRSVPVPPGVPSSPPSSSSAPTRVTRSLSLLNVGPDPQSSPGEISGYPTPHPSSSQPPPTPTHAQHTFTAPALTAWYSDKISSIIVRACCTICKIWIKVVEPKKQTNFPYLSGDTGKPPWWPENVRHREPEHLVKAERVKLLLTILQSTGIPVIRLEAATEGEAAFFPEAALHTLREIYRVAKEEQKAIKKNNNAPIESLTVMLPLPLPTSPQEEIENTRPARHRPRRSVTSLNSDEPGSRQRPAHSPYPLSRSTSSTDVHTSHPSSRALSRSHSSAGITNLSSSRNGRRPKSLKPEGTEDGMATPFGGSPQLQSPQTLQPAINLYAQNEHPSSGQRRNQGSGSLQSSPHLGLGEKPSHRSPTERYNRSQEPSFASPAMIKSRSRLSQQPSPMVPISETAPPSSAQDGIFRQQQQQLPREAIPIQVHAGHNLDPYQYPNGYPTPTYPTSALIYEQQAPIPMEASLSQPHHPHHQQPHFIPHPYPPHPHSQPLPSHPQFQSKMSEEEHLHHQAQHLRELEFQRAQEVQARQMHRYLHDQAVAEETQRMAIQQQHGAAPPPPEWDGQSQLASAEMQMVDSQSHYYYTPESLDGSSGPVDPHAIAYIQQLTEYELERHQHEHVARALQTDGAVGLGLDQAMYDNGMMASEAERREANQRRYHEHVFGTQS
ncbi:hypothetical protein T439DRAFT_379175 [Meredithblackwellia eburnea MCA 4105]